uniref:Integrase catalytic domain-containing protein n=1 Tax=Fagus sylvatica TaxID=28930 RepID=A0A2N9IP74_FAGSY
MANSSGSLNMADIMKNCTLSGPNYAEWKRRVDLYMGFYGYGSCIKTECPTEPNEESVDAKSIIDSLEVKFGKKSSAHVEGLWEKFIRTKLSEGEDARQHVINMIALADELALQGRPIDEKTKISTILSSLPYSYDTLRQIYFVSGLDWKLDDLLSKVTAQEDAKLRVKEFSVNVVEQKGFVPQGSKRFEKKRKFKNGRSDWKNNKRAYVRQDVEVKTKQIICYHCKKPGHKRSECHSLLRSREKQPQDSGATAHISNTMQGFKEIQKISDEASYIYMGNDAKAKIEGIGKSEALEKFITYRLEVEKWTDNKLKSINSDRGGEYFSNDFERYCIENGIVHFCTPPYTPEANGIAERRNRTLLDMVRSMMARANLPTSFWGEAILTAMHILNRIPTKALEKTPHELFVGKTASISHIRVWGCVAHVLIPDSNRDKLLSKTKRCVMVGYPQRSRGYRLYDPESRVILESRNVKFLEDRFDIEGIDDSQKEVLEEQKDTEPIVVKPLDPSPLRRRSTRISKGPDMSDYHLYNSENYDKVKDPSTYSQAIKDFDSKKWISAMNEEFDSMGKNVVRIQSIRAILSLVAFFDFELYQMDVKTAFLNGDLEEDVYMEQPEGFISKGDENKVCKLEKSIYGLKQASRQWNLKFHESITMMGFMQNSSEPCVYVRKIHDKVVILTLYVDDILLAGNDVDMLDEVKQWLFKTFEMKDLGEASYILGIKIERDRVNRKLSLSQENYIDTLLEKFHMVDCLSGRIPYNNLRSLSQKDCPKNDQETLDPKLYPYASAVGSLMYLMICTRPDIAFAVGMVSRFQSNPGKMHWMAIQWIFRYLKRTKGLKLTYHGSTDLKLHGFSDSDYQGCLDSRKSTSGFVFMLCGGAIVWKSKKQECVAQSTMEAEYVALNAAAKEAIFLKQFLAELQIVECVQKPIPIFCDNNSAIAISKDPRCHSRAKHIEGRYHYIRDMIKKKKVIVQKVSSKQNLADPFTKGLSSGLFETHVLGMGLC